MNKKIKLNTQKNIFKIIFSIKIAVVLTFFVIYEMLLVTHINEKGYGRWILEAALMLTITVALSCIIHFKQKIECESFDNNDFYWYWFTNIAGIGVKTQKKLLEHFGHPSTIYNAPESEIKGILTTGQCKEVIASKNQKKIEASIRKLEKREIYFFHRESQEYPERLAQLYEPPNLLYYIGRLPNFSKPILAIVGARRATIYGRKMAREFAKSLAECGIQIVSGMAAGVDAAGHKGALDANGYTLGVLGGGIDTIYPVENFNLYQQVYQMGGVLSEYNMGISPQKGLFPMRNRIISGLSDGIFVTEAGARSGSLITADQGLEQGKDIFALPGRITDCMSRGCNDLISQGAVLVRSPEDIMDIIIKEGKTGNKKKNMDVNREKFFKKQKFFCENKKEEKVYSLLDEIHPMTFENLLENSGFSAFELQHILMKFELKNIIYQIEQNVYLRKV